MKEKLANFFKKLNNSYIIAAICMILVCVILLGLMIGLVAHPFATNTTYTAKVKTEVLGETFTTKAKLVLMDEGRFSMTLKDGQKQYYTYFGDYGYGKLVNDENVRQSVIWFEYDGLMYSVDQSLFGDGIFSSMLKTNMSEQTNPFKIQYGKVTFTNVGGILLLVLYCFVIVIAAAIATVLLLKRKDGNVVFTSKIRLIKRLRELEDMLGVRLDI